MMANGNGFPSRPSMMNSGPQYGVPPQYGGGPQNSQHVGPPQQPNMQQQNMYRGPRGMEFRGVDNLLEDPNANIVFGLVDTFGKRRSPDEIRIIREILDEDIVKFCLDSKVDDAATRDLKAQTVEIQWAVLKMGPVCFSTNPSATLVARIRDVKRGIPTGGGRFTPANSQPAIIDTSDPSKLSDVDRFVLDNGLDNSAAIALRSEPLEVQRLVVGQGPLVNCYNPNGALMGRIRQARNGQAPYGQRGGGGGSRPVAPMFGQNLMPANPMQSGGHHVPGGSPLGGTPPPIAIEDGMMSAEIQKAIQQINSRGP